VNKNKIIAGVIASMCNIPISIVLSSMIHIQLLKVEYPRNIIEYMK